MKKLTSKVVLALALAVAASTGVAADADAAAKKLTVKNNVTVKGTEKTINLGNGKKVKLTASAALKKVATSNKKVAKLSGFKKGKKTVTVQGKKKGSAKVTLTAKNGKKATIKVNVKAKAITKITMDKKVTIKGVGKTYSLKPKFTPSKSKVNTTLKYTTSNKNVAAVSTKGKITGKKVGTAKITAKATDGSGKNAVCTVTVAQKYTQFVLNPSGPSANVKISGLDVATAEKDLLAAIKLVGLEDSTMTVDVNGVEKTVKYEVNGDKASLTVDGTPLSQIKSTSGKISVTITAKMADTVGKLGSIALLAESKYTDVVVTVGSHEFKNLKVTDKGKITFTACDKDYKAYASSNKLQVKGNATELQTLLKDYATIKPVYLAK